MRFLDHSVNDNYISPAELKAIEVHKYYLSERVGYDVGQEFAIRDWLSNHARQWHQARLKDDLALQRQEMLRHKWIESKKAGHDLGPEAIKDWISRYAAAWRKWREQH